VLEPVGGLRNGLQRRGVGACVGSNAVVCIASTWSRAGTCDPASGTCSPFTSLAGKACENGTRAPRPTPARAEVASEPT
jgi:hypothetical protein